MNKIIYIIKKEMKRYDISLCYYGMLTKAVFKYLNNGDEYDVIYHNHPYNTLACLHLHDTTGSIDARIKLIVKELSNCSQSIKILTLTPAKFDILMVTYNTEIDYTETQSGFKRTKLAKQFRKCDIVKSIDAFQYLLYATCDNNYQL